MRTHIKILILKKNITVMIYIFKKHVFKNIFVLKMIKRYDCHLLVNTIRLKSILVFQMYCLCLVIDENRF